MDTKRWSEVKHRVRKGVEDVARQILKTEAERALAKGFAFSEESHIEREFADSFPFEETPDQKNAIDNILRDMSMYKPMDRILVGDVGFGKTEVVMRAAFKCVAGGRQASVLVPTTILADQHYRTFKERFAGFPVNIAMLCRFQTRAEQKKVLLDLAAGAIDIIIGTHRLLQKDIRFKELGLMAVDEEHRFGVKDKEKLKVLAKGVHTLMLSATPIPRTLYQTLSSLRDMSVIESPPTGRLPISTVTAPWKKETVISAIRAELSRAGQVYYVHNRVETLPSRINLLKSLVPEARFCMAHGQMDSAILEETMWDFAGGKYDVLAASSIIESGLDIPSANTLIVDGAHEFGLAQLYQLRGRIGREKQKAFCYLLYPEWLKMEKPSDSPSERKDTLSEDARKRLSALQEFTELGSGFRLAMRDLEIRGAGELLGTKQHGFLNEVGLGLYCELLTQEINRLKKAGTQETPEETAVDLKISAYIPDDYLPDDLERLNFYKRFLNAEADKLKYLLEELEELCGKAPEPVRNMADLMILRKKAARIGVRLIRQTETGIDIFFSSGVRVPADSIIKWQSRYGEGITFMPSKMGDGIRLSGHHEKPLETVREAISDVTINV